MSESAESRELSDIDMIIGKIVENMGTSDKTLTNIYQKKSLSDITAEYGRFSKRKAARALKAYLAELSDGERSDYGTVC